MNQAHPPTAPPDTRQARPATGVDTPRRASVAQSLSRLFQQNNIAPFTGLGKWKTEKAAKSMPQLACPYLPKPIKLPFWFLGTDVTPEPQMQTQMLEYRSSV